MNIGLRLFLVFLCLNALPVSAQTSFYRNELPTGSAARSGFGRVQELYGYKAPSDDSESDLEANFEDQDSGRPEWNQERILRPAPSAGRQHGSDDPSPRNQDHGTQVFHTGVRNQQGQDDQPVERQLGCATVKFENSVVGGTMGVANRCGTKVVVAYCARLRSGAIHRQVASIEPIDSFPRGERFVQLPDQVAHTRYFVCAAKDAAKCKPPTNCM